jgi:citrate lyase subunit beta/citryl-CoA lyase
MTAGRESREPVRWETQPLRALLFAPGSEPRKLSRVGDYGADGIVLDQEHAVAETEKDDARAAVRASLAGYTGTQVVAVRVNGPETSRLEDDIRAVVTADLDCVMVPKVEEPSLFVALDALLLDVEARQGLPARSVRILATIETAAGVVRVNEIAAAGKGRLVTLVFGLVDFSRDLGIDLSAEGDELLYARSRIVLAARAAGLAAPLDGPYLDLDDLEGVEREARRSRSLGFGGRVVIHPRHVEPTQQAFAQLSDEERESCHRVVEEFERAESQGLASIRVDGRFVDYPVYIHAKRKLALDADFHRMVER